MACPCHLGCLLFGLSAYLFSNDAKTVHRFIEGCEFGELYSGMLGDDGTHGLEKYSRRRTAYVSWREDTAADLMPADPRSNGTA